MKRLTLVAVFIVLVLSLLFLLSSIFFGSKLENIKTDPLLGNRENISNLNEENVSLRPFSFFVVGDNKLEYSLEYFLKNVEFPVTPDFSVLLGDFARNAVIEDHNFFINQFSGPVIRYPLLLIAGNHDIAVTEERMNKINAFKVEDFENTYGPLNFHFTYAGCLFVGVNDYGDDTYIDYLEDVLSQSGDSPRMKFVFMHIPPNSISSFGRKDVIPSEEKFVKMMDKYNVDYVFTGHFHSYLRIDSKKTKYIITGGGGATLDKSTPNRSFHHAILIAVDPENRHVDEMIFPIKSKLNPLYEIKILMLIETYPFFKYNKVPEISIIVLNILLILLVGYLLIRPSEKK